MYSAKKICFFFLLDEYIHFFHGVNCIQVTLKVCSADFEHFPLSTKPCHVFAIFCENISVYTEDVTLSCRIWFSSPQTRPIASDRTDENQLKGNLS